MGLRAAAVALGILLAAGLAPGATPVLAAPEDFVEACSNGIAVPDPEDNPGLVQDCAILLSIRDTLAGDATLNWRADRPIHQWDGVEAEGRVVRLYPRGQQLSGKIPPELGLLDRLILLSLYNHQLTGEIPPELGSLLSLRGLDLARNQLTGEIPSELGSLESLQWLYLYSNQLTGEIPPELGALKALRFLELAWNRLTGEIPPELGTLQLLEYPDLHGNQLTGCVPGRLRDINRDIVLPLPNCPDPDPGDTGTGLAPAPPGALPLAVNGFVVLATAVAVLGIVAGLRTRSRP